MPVPSALFCLFFQFQHSNFSGAIGGVEARETPLKLIFISSAVTFLSAEFQAFKSPNCVLSIRRSIVRKNLRRHPRAELATADERLFFKHREQFVPAFAAERELLFLFFCKTPPETAAIHICARTNSASLFFIYSFSSIFANGEIRSSTFRDVVLTQRS